MAGILRRPGGSRHLANALSGKEIDQDTAIHATRLLEVSDRKYPELADKLAQAGGLDPLLPALSSSDRNTLLSMIADGKAVRGRAIYERAALACNVCHRVDGEGGLVGPDLSSIGASAPADYLLDSLLNPSAKIKEGYRMSIVTLKNQNVISGAISRETRNALVIRSAFGKETRIPKMEIASRQISSVSMMPGGLVAGLREDELVDLLAYLSSLGRTANK
jgi:putative heme-binding domain-containing protein